MTETNIMTRRGSEKKKKRMLSETDIETEGKHGLNKCGRDADRKGGNEQGEARQPHMLSNEERREWRTRTRERKCVEEYKC